MQSTILFLLSLRLNPKTAYSNNYFTDFSIYTDRLFIKQLLVFISVNVEGRQLSLKETRSVLIDLMFLIVILDNSLQNDG